MASPYRIMNGNMETARFTLNIFSVGYAMPRLNITSRISAFICKTFMRCHQVRQKFCKKSKLFFVKVPSPFGLPKSRDFLVLGPSGSLGPVPSRDLPETSWNGTVLLESLVLTYPKSVYFDPIYAGKSMQ